jgi:hypothetical protein
MVPIAKIFFMFKLLDTCEVPEVRVQVDMREAPDGSCAASVRYLAPGRAYYSAVELGDGNISVGSLSDLSPALEFLEQGEFEDGWMLSTSGYLQFETDFAPPQILEIDAASCTCR